MKMNFKKNQMVIFAISLMLVAAGYLSYTTKEPKENLLPTSALADTEQIASIGDATLVSANVQTTNTEQKQDNYFVQSRLDRDNMYSQMLANYQTILESNNVATDEKKMAQEEIKRIHREKNALMIAENLIKTKGFEDIILFLNSGNVSAIVKAEKLEQEQVAQLQNILTRELAIEANKINISNKK